MKLRIKNLPITVIGKPKEMAVLLREMGPVLINALGIMGNIEEKPDSDAVCNVVMDTEKGIGARGMTKCCVVTEASGIATTEDESKLDPTLYTVWGTIKITREDILRNIDPIKGIDMDKFQYDPDRDTGYFGRIDSDDFIPYMDLATKTGMIDVDGAKMMKEDKGWLVFWYKGDVVFIPQHPIMYNVSWDAIYKLDLVAQDNTIVVVDDKDYYISLMTGARSNPVDVKEWLKADADEELKIDLGYGSMWNELIYRVHKDRPGKDDISQDCSGGPQHGNDWDNLTNEELNVDWAVCDVGTATWCQETYSHDPSGRVHRGYGRLALSYGDASTYVYVSMGWRPVLLLKKKH
jgi:hypothetical protein